MEKTKNKQEVEQKKKHSGGVERYTPQQVIDEINNCSGFRSVVAKRLGIGLRTLDGYTKRYPEVAEAYQTARNEALDLAESKLYELIQEKDKTTILFFLKTQGKERGYSEKPLVYLPARNEKHFFVKMNSIYYDLLNTSARYVMLYGGAGSGKSYAVADWLLFKIYNTTDAIRILYGRKFFKHIKQSQFALLQSRIAFYGLEADFIVNKSDYRITCKHNKAELIAIGLDDPEKIKSIHDPVAVWIEEATELNSDDIQQLDLRLRTKLSNMQIIFTFNPISKKHVIRQRFMDNLAIPMGEPITCDYKVKTDEGEVELSTYILKTNYKHNKYLPAEYIASLEHMQKVNPEYYDVYVNAEWGDAGAGWLFKRDLYEEYTDIPNDARGVVYCDPNLSKKGQGDTTAIVKLLFSPAQQCYFVEDVVCKSYSDANELLKDLFRLYHNDNRLFGIAFDGNVNQESQWTQHVRNFSQIYNTPVPVIDYKHYNVNDLAKNASMLWSDGKIKFREGIKNTDEGAEFLSQLYFFAGKKNNNKSHDDAPDALVCAIQALFERGYRITNNNLVNIKGLI